MKKYLFGLVLGSIVSLVLFGQGTYAVSLTATELTTKIIQTADANSYPKESLVQRYYSIEDLFMRVQKISPSHTTLARLGVVKDNLRNEINKRKNTTLTTRQDNLLSQYQSLLVNTSGLSNLCKNNYEIADDWAYAFDLPTSLVLATWDIETSCGMYKPSNRNGVFQLTARDYGVSENLTKGEWIMMMYDYAKLVKGKITWYHTSNSLSASTCDSKSTTTIDQIAPVCLNYGSLDLDSIIKYGALYNGLSGSTIKGNIKPAVADYVFGKFGPDNQTANKDGLVMRILKVLDYNKKK